MEEIKAVTHNDLCLWQQQTNLFTQKVLAFLIANPRGTTEHQLLTHLRALEPPLMPMYNIADHLSLFRCHFWLFHILYRLRDQLRQNQQAELYISPLFLQLLPYAPQQSAEHPELPDALKEYYLDLSHLEATTEDAIEALMRGTFKRIDAKPQQAAALQILGLKADASWDDIRHQYRLLAQKHHPDRGGSSARFQEIQSAIEVLKQCNASF